MNIFKDLIDNFTIYYKNEKYVFYYFDCDALKNEIDSFTLNKGKVKFYIENDCMYSENIPGISGIFVIGKSDKISDKFPYPFILDCDNPILIEVNSGNIIKFKQLSDLVMKIRRAYINANQIIGKKFYNELCDIYGKDLINVILPYEDIVYYFN